METSVIPIEDLQPELSGFGIFLYKLMLSKGIKTFNALATVMESEEYRIFRQSIVKMARGDQNVQPRFCRKLAEVLALTESEERELAWMLYKFG